MKLGVRQIYVYNLRRCPLLPEVLPAVTESLSIVPFETLLLAAPVATLKEEATQLAQAEKQSVSGVVDKGSIIRGLSNKPGVIAGPHLALTFFDPGFGGGLFTIIDPDSSI